MVKTYFVVIADPLTEVLGPYKVGTTQDDPEVLAELAKVAGIEQVYCVQASGAARALTSVLNRHRATQQAN